MNRAEAMEALRGQMRERQRMWSDGRKVIAGDFTYAWGPIVKSWGEEARLIIGKFCSIAGNIQFFLGGDHRPDWCTTYPFAELLPEQYPEVKGSPRSKGDIVIGNDVWIGNDAKIMSGIRIGDGAVIAGSAVVTRDVQPYSVVGGVPARFIKYRFERWAEVWGLRWWDWPLEKIAAAVPIIESQDVDALIRFDMEWGR